MSSGDSNQKSVDSKQTLQSIVDGYYENFYKRVHGSGGVGKLESWMHKALESDAQPSKRLLEVGAGNFEHLPFIASQVDTYVAVDPRVPDQEDLDRWRVKVIDVTEVATATSGRFFVKSTVEEFGSHDVGRFDRIVATCVLLHLDDPASTMTTLLDLMEESGAQMRLLLPTEPSWLVNSWRTLMTRRRSKKLGFEHFDLVNAIDHQNYSQRITTLSRYVFANENWRRDSKPFASPFDILTPFSIIKVDR